MCAVIIIHVYLSNPQSESVLYKWEVEVAAIKIVKANLHGGSPRGISIDGSTPAAAAPLFIAVCGKNSAWKVTVDDT